MKKIVLSSIVAVGLAVGFSGCASSYVAPTFESSYNMTINDLNSLSEDKQIEMIKKSSGKRIGIFENIKNPSEKVQIAAVKQSEINLKYIKNPSEKVQIAALADSMWNDTIKYIKNPSEKVQAIAVMNNGNAIEVIKDQTLYLQILAVRSRPDSYKFITNKSKYLLAYLYAYQNSKKDGLYYWKGLEKVKHTDKDIEEGIGKDSIEFKKIENTQEMENFIKIIRDVKNIKEIQNPTEEITILAALLDAKYLNYVKNPSDELLETLIKLDASNIRYMKNPSPQYVNLSKKYTEIQKQYLVDKEKREIELLEAKGAREIKDMENPSEKVQLFAMNLYNGGAYYEYIDSQNISDEVKLAAIKTRPDSFAYMKNASEKVVLAAIKASTYNLKHVENLTENIQLEVLSKNPDYIKDIKEPNEKLQMVAVKQDPMSIQYISNPTEKIKLQAINSDVNTIKYISNPTEEIQLIALQVNPDLIKEIVNPSEKVQLIVVKQNPELIQYIKNPSEKVQLFVLKKDILLSKYIKNPTDEANKVIADTFFMNYKKGDVISSKGTYGCQTPKDAVHAHKGVLDSKEQQYPRAYLESYMKYNSCKQITYGIDLKVIKTEYYGQHKTTMVQLPNNEFVWTVFSKFN